MYIKIQKIFFVSEIIVSENVAINCVCEKRIFFIGSQWLNKQSKDVAFHSERLIQPECL